jgi:hypothetical protein
MGEDGILFEHTAPCHDTQRRHRCQGRWRGVVSLGNGPDGEQVRRKVSGKPGLQKSNRTARGKEPSAAYRAEIVTW